MKQIKTFLLSKVPMLVYLLTSIILIVAFCIAFKTIRNIEPTENIKGTYQAKVNADLYDAIFDGENYCIYYFKFNKGEAQKLILTDGTYEKYKENTYLLKDGEKRYLITLLHNKFYFQIPERDKPMNDKMDTVLEFKTDGTHALMKTEYKEMKEVEIKLE